MKEVLGPIPMEGRLHSYTTRLCHGLSNEKEEAVERKHTGHHSFM